MDIIEKIGSKKPVMLNFSKGSLKDIIIRALETYNLHKKSGIIAKIAANLGDNDVICIIMISYALVISYYTKLGYNNIAVILGRKILEYIY